MGWNIELACIRSPGATIETGVPDVFGFTGQLLGFEEATSVQRGRDLCAVQVKDWIIVIDTMCRLSDYKPWHKEISATGELYVFRIADAPLELHFRDGRKQFEHRGLEQCLQVKAREDRDGELLAIDLLKERTQLGFTDDLWDVRFAVFALD